MSPNKKVLLTVLSFVLALAVIACSCSSLLPTATTQPPSNGQEPMPGLVGTWQDPETTDTFVIAWQNNQYVVTSVTWKTNSYSITSQSWNGSSLTWTYYDDTLPETVTYTTTSLSGDSLNVEWSYASGASGTETLGRVK
jgi:hypothetical protein